MDIKQLIEAIEHQTAKVIKIEQENAVAVIRARNKLVQFQQQLAIAQQQKV